MSDLALLLFGCCVSFVGAAGAYVYLRESLEREARRVVRAEASDTSKSRETGKAA
jgi:hypothetical protein